MKQLYLFDFDGVLVDSISVYEKTVMLCLTKIGQPIIRNREEFLDLFDENFYEAIEKRGVDLEAFAKASVSILAEVNFDEIKPILPVFPVLAAMKTNHILIVISSNGSAAIRTALSRYHFNGCFQEIYGSDFKYSKKEKIDYAVLKYGIPRDRTFYIGDTAGDIVEAKMAGVRSVAVTWGWHDRDRLAKANPDFIVDTPDGLLRIGDESRLQSL